ncbi:hypothetical protein GDO86_011490 [Hymenochirus boettgeri]|uniref:WH2 domain-containing protein n=1 Tax=Hymenochirus boettgeri TaxID=247094 RepID=A0A8T2JJC6_9PIPI|nr:hypothetical protein GDO86_011490 [Hymenochirus boettgeri]
METPVKLSTGKRLKAKAPLPPIQTSQSKSSLELRSYPELDGTENKEDMKENMINRKVNLTIYLPDNHEKSVTVDGSKAVMDLLVDLCSQYHLNPAHHIIEAKSEASKQPFILRPNTLIGTLHVPTVYLKEKADVKLRKPAPMIPEKTVRLIVNFLGTQKTVVRVNPEVPLLSILSTLCEKCEFQHENVILLRDNVSKEELDMTKTIKDLDIKELYAWNSKEEKKRNLSTNSDNTEKEKKGIWGFFHSYSKNNKGNSTVPNSPSVNIHPVTLGASLSLNNISRIDTKPEIKKRRAPHPPKLAPLDVVVEKTMEQKTPEQHGTQNEEQKKKRRAPPPPIVQMPNEKEEDKETKKESSTGNGRHVPQKPPRGTSRSPPILEIPPPPPYPPPEQIIMDLPVFENGVAVTESTKFVPVPAKRDKSLKKWNSVSSEDLLTVDLLATDGAASLNSNSEDSGMVSSPSDSISLDFYGDDTQNRESLLNKKNAKEILKIDSNSQNSKIISTSRGDPDVSSVRNGDEDIFISAQFQKTLEELDNDSEDMDDEDITYINHISSKSICVVEKCVSPELVIMTDTEVPVTIIDEVPNVNIQNLRAKENETTHLKEKSVKQMVNLSHMEEHSSLGMMNRGASSLNGFPSNSQGMEPQSNNSKQDAKSSKLDHNVFKHENGSNPREMKPSLSSPSATQRTNHRFINKKVEEFSQKTPAEKYNIEEEQRMTYINSSYKEPAKPPLFQQQTYEPKAGMRTFTVVPPKPDLKRYDRGASLSASAIKIDDLGNLISPHIPIAKKGLNDSFSGEQQGPLVEKAKEFWRSSSMEVQTGDVKEQPAKFIKSTKTKQQEPNNCINDNSVMRATAQTFNIVEASKKQLVLKNNIPSQQVQIDKVHSPLSYGMLLNKAPLRENGFQHHQHSYTETASQEKMIIVEKTSNLRTNLPFFEPNKRTSSQYVESGHLSYLEPSTKAKIEKKEANQEIKCENKNFLIDFSAKPENIIVGEVIVERKTFSKNTATDMTKISGNKTFGSETTGKNKVVHDQQPLNVKREHFSGLQFSEGDTKNATVEQTSEKTSSLYSSPYEFQINSASSSNNAFLKAVKDRSGKIEQSLLSGFSSEQMQTEDKGNFVPSTIIDAPESPSNSNVFGPKVKLRPVLQKQVQKETSLHSALMVAIQSGEGKEKLRKIQISSTASNELNSIRNTELLVRNEEMHTHLQSLPLVPLFPPPPPPSMQSFAVCISTNPANNSVDTREALLEAIRSGAGASKLKKVI